MAFLKNDKATVQLVGEISVTAYVRVSHVAGTKTSVAAQVAFHKDNAAGEMYKSDSHVFVPDMNGGNFIKQAYDYLKTLPEFADAVDC